MATRKKDETSHPFDYDEARAALAASMTTLHIAREEELPHIDLYLDQVLSIVRCELAPLYEPGEKIITGSMVNNYVKQRIVPAPSRRRYTRTHLAYLLLVCTFKRVLPIASLTQVIHIAEQAQVDFARAYDDVLTALEQAVAARFACAGTLAAAPRENHVTLHDTQGTEVQGPLPQLAQAAIDLVANKVYLEKLLALEGRRAAASHELL